MNLKDRALLVDLDLSIWTGRKQDKTAAVNAASATGSDVNRLKVTKALIDPTRIQPIQTIASEARAWFKLHSLAWDNFRIIPSDTWIDMLRELGLFKSRFETAVLDLAREYPDLIQAARRPLNGLFHIEDYPQDIVSQYGFRWKVRPLPEEEDFRVSLADCHLADLREQLKTDLQAQIGVAMKDAWTRLEDAVRHLHERLSDPQAIFRDTLIDNVVDLCKVLPKLNLTQDPTFAQTIQEVTDKLTVHDAQSLRDNKTARAVVAADAAALVNKMKAYI